METNGHPSRLETVHPALCAAVLVALDAYGWWLHGGRGTLLLAAGLILQAPVLFYLVHLMRMPVDRRPRWNLPRRYPWLTSKPTRVSTNPADYMLLIGGAIFLLTSWLASR